MIFRVLKKNLLLKSQDDLVAKPLKNLLLKQEDDLESFEKDHKYLNKPLENLLCKFFDYIAKSLKNLILKHKGDLESFEHDQNDVMKVLVKVLSNFSLNILQNEHVLFIVILH